jgi:hypothetical protein
VVYLIQQITIFLENKPGSLYNVTSILAKADIDIRAISMVETSDLVLLRIVVNEHNKAVKVLKENTVSFRDHDVLGVEVIDKPGGLSELAAIFAKNNINIEYTYPFVTKGHDKAYLVVNTDNLSKSEKLLEKSGVNLLSENDFYNI